MAKSHFRLMVCALLVIPFITACSLQNLKNLGKKDTPVSVVLSQHEQALLHEAVAARKEGKAQEAIAAYRQAMEISKGAVVAHLELASLYNEQRRYEEAQTVLSEGLAQQPDNAELFKERASAAIALGRPESAIEDLDKAIAIAPQDARLYSNKGVALDMQKKYEAAQTSYKRAVALSPKDSGYIENNLALSLLSQGKISEAIILLERLVKSPNATPRMRQNLALAYGVSGKSEKARALGLKDLSPQQADSNQKFYESLSPAAGKSFQVPDTSVPVVAVSGELPPPSSPEKK